MTTDDFTFTTKDDTEAMLDTDNVLTQLKGIIQREIRRPQILVSVPERPGVYVRISPNITQAQMRAWRKNAGEDSKRGLDTLKFSCNVIAATCTGIEVNGTIVTNDSGIELTFASPEIMEMTGTTRPHPDCVLAFFGLEPHVESAAVVVIEAAGYGENVESMDPTKRSSED